jgi:hypothetical protein
MKKPLRTIIQCALLSLCLCAVGRADLKVKQRTTNSGQTSESTTMIKGARQRTESSYSADAPSQVNITQCDLHRMLMINDTAHRYFVFPFDQGDNASTNTAASAPPVTSAPATRGGTIVITNTITDTGERKQLFGLTARHLKTKMTMEPSPDACDKSPFHQETDGWYTDFEYGLNCPTSASMARGPHMRSGGCQDRTVLRQSGTARLGFPLSVTTTTYGPDGQVTSTSTVETIELSHAPLDVALFDVPSGYTEAHSPQELYAVSASDATSGMMGGQQQQAAAGNNESMPATPAAPAAKQPGAIRVGVAQVKDLTDKNLSADAARAHLISALTSAGLEAVPLNAYTPDGLNDEAKEKQCDFFLTTDIASLKLSAARKLGGMFGRATGVGSAGVDRTEAQLNFKLYPVGSNSPQLQSAANAKEEGDDPSLNAALDKEAQTVAKEAKKKH